MTGETRLAILTLLMAAGCRPAPIVPPTGGQAATVRRAVNACISASTPLAPALQTRNWSAARRVAGDARFTCDASAGAIAEAVGRTSALEPCRQAVLALERTQSRELAVLERRAPVGGPGVLPALDQAIALQTRCDAALAPYTSTLSRSSTATLANAPKLSATP